ncbi:hypothetical protein A1O3_00982 [Capronia epimyces CBS 606.96]|uniref:FAD/NAD(P)-binding domain-containing protein n=1 Tax=Capronia epimyces CBS 606.96 TaxID=1182542 RepID=W9YT58_9EURO|nr:uncharacterized protein A1O3_00982 [Capronia epimyces CBS 606.96]EXJ92431.1 hypothetical protein A1O3_00982 [Capronia epimyces CBS 606.96]
MASESFTVAAPPAPGGPDLQELEHKYAEEADKRWKARPEHQYLALREIRDAEFAKDPWVDYERARAFETQREVHDGDFRQVVIVGAGHNGILFAARLIDAGIEASQILIIDNGSGFGGVWYWNRYPGLMCDVESYIYLPLLEETGYIPTRRYARGEEIRGHAERIAQRYGMQALFTTTATSMDWDDERVEWTTQVRRDLGPDSGGVVELKIRSQFLFVAAGPLTGPKMPDVPGIDEYLAAGGQMFHSARWDYSITGGTQAKPELTKLRDKSVAVVGTAATAVQLIPEVAKYARELYVCQRTPSYVGLRGQRDTDRDEFRTRVAVKPGWQGARADNFNLRISNDPEPENLVGDGWTEVGGWAAFQGGKGKFGYDPVPPDGVADHVAYFMELDQDRANRIRALVDRLVADYDPKVAENLKAWYPGWCKRPIFHDDYLPTFTRPNVHLVDMDGRGIDRFTATGNRPGLVAGGQEYPVDLVILATGFEVPPYASAETRAAAPIRGRHGRVFDQKWNDPADFGTLHGFMAHGFPNLFFQGVFGQASSSNLTRLYDFQAQHLAFIVAKAVAKAAAENESTGQGQGQVQNGIKEGPDQGQAEINGQAPHSNSDSRKTVAVVETSKAAEDAWTDQLAKRALFWTTLPICTPGYFNGDAQVKPPGTSEELALAAKRVMWPGGVTDYGRTLIKWREAGEWKSIISTRSVEVAVPETNGVDKA